MKRIVSSWEEPEELGSGYGGPHGPTEGPGWFSEDSYLLFIDIAGVYRVSPDLKNINTVVRDFVNPNGLCFSPDERVLYINDSNRHRKLIKAFDVEANGMVDRGSERLFIDMKGDDRPGGPDGMKVDVEGNLYCTGPGGIWVMQPDGTHIGTIQTRAVNLNWGGPDWTTLFFTGPTT